MRYLVLAFLFAATVVAYIQRSAIGVPTKTIETDLDIGPRGMGLVMGTWFWVYAVCQLPAGWLADRWGSRAALAGFAVVWSLLTGAVGLATGFLGLLLLWGVMGGAQAGIFPCSTKAVGALFPPAGRAFASGVLGCGMAVGWTISPRITAELLQHLTWQQTFAVYALPGLAWAAAFALLVPRFPEPAAVRTGRSGGRASLIKLVTDVPMILLCLQQFLRAAAVAFFFTWFVRYLTETRNLSKLEAGELAIWPGVGGIFGGLFGGTVSEWLYAKTGNARLSRQGLAVFAMLASAASALGAGLVADVNVAVFLLALGAFWGYVGGVSGYAVAIGYGGRRVATVFATMNMCGNFGAGLFPFVVGWLVGETGNWDLALLLVAGLFAADAVVWAVLNPKGTLFPEDEP